LDIAQQRTIHIIQVVGNTTSSFEILVKKISWKAGQFKVSGDRM